MFVFTAFFFMIAFLSAYKKQGFDVYTYILFIYLVGAFFGVLLDSMDLYVDFDYPKKSIGFIAPLSYCLLLFLCIRPFNAFKSNSIKHITSINEKVYNFIVYFYFCIFVIILLASLMRIGEVMNAQNLAAMRSEFYQGDAASVWSSYSGFPRLILAGLSLWSGSGVIMLLFFFVNIIKFKKKLWFNIITLLGATTPLVLALYSMDRSSFINWFLVFGLLYVIFRKQLKAKDLKSFMILIIPVIMLMVVYLYRVTLSRFGEQSGGNAFDGFVYYAGQSLFHYCYFFNDLDINAPFSLVELFPFTYNKILNQPSYFEQCEIVSNYCHYGVSNFSTFLGMILSMSGKIVMLIFVFLYIVLINKIIFRPNKETISLKQLIYFFIVAKVVVNGLFGYCYLEYMSTIYIITWILYARILFKREKNLMV